MYSSFLFILYLFFMYIVGHLRIFEAPSFLHQQRSTPELPGFQEDDLRFVQTVTTHIRCEDSPERRFIGMIVGVEDISPQ
ncbi:hypothetical protein L1987_30285 [Smallanthus sonchifolius]|uniref:Uncharacterized protein n=1 Tax=Smallanthus sonchifolius TaxID=185202 RepID=A0ACB9I306_9ASTR|nr:hypothetical protein L1987_30285 [Smallanthus sonchifolius]